MKKCPISFWNFKISIYYKNLKTTLAIWTSLNILLLRRTFKISKKKERKLDKKKRKRSMRTQPRKISWFMLWLHWNKFLAKYTLFHLFSIKKDALLSSVFFHGILKRVKIAYFSMEKSWNSVFFHGKVKRAEIAS